MRGLLDYHRPKDDFYLYVQRLNQTVINQTLEFFYDRYFRILEKDVLKIEGSYGRGGIVYDEMHDAVEDIYTKCGGTAAELPYHSPSVAERAAMNESQKWAKINDEGDYALEFLFDPQYWNDTLVQCFKGDFDEWYATYLKDRAHNMLNFIIIYLTVGVPVLLGCVAGVVYLMYRREKNKTNKKDNKPTTESQCARWSSRFFSKLPSLGSAPKSGSLELSESSRLFQEVREDEGEEQTPLVVNGKRTTTSYAFMMWKRFLRPFQRTPSAPEPNRTDSTYKI